MVSLEVLKGSLMKDDKSGKLLNSKVAVAGGVIFFALFYLYVFRVVETSLIYQRFALNYYFPAFEMGWDFFAGFAAVPGGIVDYVGNFLSQWYYYNFAGAAVITAVAFAIFLATRKLLVAFGAAGWGFIAYLPAAAIIAMATTNDYVLLSLLAAIASLWFSFVFIKVAPESTVGRVIVFAAMFAVLYYLTVGGALVFAIIASVYELLIKRKLIIAAVYPLTAVVCVWLIGMVIFCMDARSAFLCRLELEGMITTLTKTAFYGMYGVILLSLVTAGLVHTFKRSRQRSAKVKPASRVKFFVTAAVKTAVVIAVSLAAVKLSFNHRDKVYLKSDCLARYDKWQELIELGKENSWLHGNPYFNHDHTRALYHTGRLEDQFFEYPQYAGALMLSFKGSRRKVRFFEKYSDILIEMGHVNHAEKCCYEVLQTAGEWPVAMNYLALINLAKGHPETARVYLERLSKDIVYGSKARELLAKMDKDPDLSEDEYIQHLRSIADDAEDRLKLGYGTDDFFYRLLRKNPKSKMAFQYMMASFLLTRQPQKVAENIHRLDDLGYEKLPRYYEQALVIHIGSSKTHDVPKKWLPSEAAWKKAREFDKVYLKYEKNKPLAMKMLAAEYGDSYYYYYIFQMTGTAK